MHILLLYLDSNCSKALLQKTEFQMAGVTEKGMKEKLICAWTEPTVLIFASNPNFIKVNCIQPQSQSNMATAWKISKVQLLCTGYRSHCVSVQPGRRWVIFEVNRKKEKQTLLAYATFFSTISVIVFKYQNRGRPAHKYGDLMTKTGKSFKSLLHLMHSLKDRGV